VTQGRTIQLKVLPVTKATRLQMAADSFYLDREANRLSPHTLAWYRAYVGALVAWCTARGIDDLAGLTADHLRTWLISVQGRDLAERTIHHHASAARTFLNFCVGEGLLTTSPMARVKMPKMPKDILPAFDAGDVHDLLTACKTLRDTAIVLCLLDTGCRAAEFVALKIGDVDRKTGAVTIRRGKGGKDRVVFLGIKARKSLTKYLMERMEAGPADSLWIGERVREPLTVRGLQKMLHRVGERAHVANCHPHTFRRSCALFSLRAGMDIYSLQKLMGHSDLEMLRRYLVQNQATFSVIVRCVS
jgi:site-specific recombinase XerD